MTDSSEVSVVLGNEWDSSLRQTLIDVLRTAGAIATSEQWGIGGSQEVDEAVFNIGGELVRVESETYVGLSISGPKSVVEQIVAEVRAHAGDRE